MQPNGRKINKKFKKKEVKCMENLKIRAFVEFFYNLLYNLITSERGEVILVNISA